MLSSVLLHTDIEYIYIHTTMLHVWYSCLKRILVCKTQWVPIFQSVVAGRRFGSEDEDLVLRRQSLASSS